MIQLALLHILLLAVLSIVSAFVGFGFNIMQQPNMIFAGYRDFLNWLCWIKDDKYPLDSDSKQYKKSMFFYYFTKPLGLCIICNTTWLGIILTLIITINYSCMTIVDCIVVGVASGGIVTLIVNKYNQLQNS